MVYLQAPLCETAGVRSNAGSIVTERAAHFFSFFINIIAATLALMHWAVLLSAAPAVVDRVCVWQPEVYTKAGGKGATKRPAQRKQVCGKAASKPKGMQQQRSCGVRAAA